MLLIFFRAKATTEEPKVTPATEEIRVTTTTEEPKVTPATEGPIRKKFVAYYAIHHPYLITMVFFFCVLGYFFISNPNETILLSETDSTAPPRKKRSKKTSEKTKSKYN
jgi:hypothetical protein